MRWKVHTGSLNTQTTERVTVLPDAGRREMYQRMIHGTDPRTGKPKRRDKSRVGRLIARQNAAPLRRAQPKRRRYTPKPIRL